MTLISMDKLDYHLQIAAEILRANHSSYFVRVFKTEPRDHVHGTYVIFLILILYI